MKKTSTIITSVLLVILTVLLSGCGNKKAVSANSPEVRINGEYVQWKNGDDDWHNLVKLDDIRSNSAVGKDGTNGADGKNGINGKDGKNIQIRNNGNYIQWRYLNEDWNNLVAVSDITGSNGKNGTDGINGSNVEIRKSNDFLQWRNADK